MMDMDLSALWVTVRLATTAVVVLLILGTRLAWWLAHTRLPVQAGRGSNGCAADRAASHSPWILYPHHARPLWTARPAGECQFWHSPSPVIASVFYSMPFVIQPLQGAFEAVGKAPLEAAWSLRASKFDAFLTFLSPMALRGYNSAIVLGFAHTVGEFGVVLMVGGSIPGQTRVLSTTIFEHVEVMEYGQAHTISAAMLMFSFLVLLAVYIANRRFPIHVS